MALPLQLTKKTHQQPLPYLLARFSSSSSPSPPPSNSNSENSNSDDSNSNSNPSPPSFSSYFSDIKDRLKTPPSPPRRIPASPSPPPPPPPSPSTSLDDIRSHLASFRLRSTPQAATPRSPSISFQDLLKNNVVSNPSATVGDRLSFDSIRESLRHFRPSDPTPRRGGEGAFSLRSLQESLRSTSQQSALPESIFGKEVREREADGRKEKQLKTEFVRMYNYEELGEKLRRLRPEGKDFSMSELNERLARLREVEEEETESRMGGVNFRELRESLIKLKTDDENKKTNMQRMSILMNIHGQATPTFMLRPPQEQLLERYFHPDHMSSAEKMKLELKRVRDEFKMSESDCGSARVQVAQLTTKIKHLSTALHKKDKHSRKGLQEMVQRRKKLLKYLRRTDWDSYCLVLSKLGLRDVPEYKPPDYKTKAKA